MAKKVRFDGAVEAFGSQAIGTERTIFGSTSQSNDINDQINSDFLRGWGIVGANDLPTKQDFNAAGYTLGYLLSYIYQFGVPEWNDTQDYHEHSIVNVGGVLYKSIQDNNTNQDPTTESAYWVEAFPSGVLNNWTATTDPTTGDDTGDGYAAGSKWFNTLSGDIFVCVDPSTGAAVWIDTGLNIGDLGSAAFSELIDDDTFATATETNIPSAESVKNYVTANKGVILDRDHDENTAQTVLAGMPYDDTIPQNTEGTEILSAAITPKSATNIIRVTAVVYVGRSATGAAAVAAFKNSDANAVAAASVDIPSVYQPGTCTIITEFVAGSTDPLTVAIRAGGSGGTTTLNSISSSRIFGGVMKSTLVIEEIAA